MPIILFAMVMLSLGACGTSALPTEPQVAAPSTVTPAADREVLADCFLSFQVEAWQDVDKNGLWDESEPPLEGVEFRLRGAFAQIWGDPFLSGADGKLSIRTWAPGTCIEQDYGITAVPPDSYEPTTAASITFALAPGDFHYEAQFGFRAETE